MDPGQSEFCQMWKECVLVHFAEMKWQAKNKTNPKNEVCWKSVPMYYDV